MGVVTGIARRKKKFAPMETLEFAEIRADTGVANDSRGKAGKRQVTLLSVRDWQAACDEVGKDIAWTARRANLYIGDFDLPKQAGQIVAIGDVRLRTTVEIGPCSRMDEQCPGLTSALMPHWRGGVGCQVIQGGVVKVGDSVSIVE